MAYIGKIPAAAAITASDLDPAVITGQTALATSPADTDEFLISDAGVLKRLDASLVGGGLVLQVITATHSTAVTQTSNAYATSGLTATITPSSSSNKVLVLTSSAIQTFGDGSSSSGRVGLVGLFRGTVSATKLAEHQSGVSMVSGTTSTNDHSYNTVSFAVLDSPSTASSQVYTVGISGSGAGEVLAQGQSNTSSITLVEIAG
jgi:hypothetical protein